MPSIEAPAYYDRAKWTAASRADDFLKWIDEIYYEDTCGTVESPLGWVGLIKIDSDLIAEYVSTMGDPWMSEARNFEPGWYIVRTDDNGLIWGMGYGSLDYTLPEEAARADYAEAERVDQVWSMEQAEAEEGENYNV